MASRESHLEDYFHFQVRHHLYEFATGPPPSFTPSHNSNVMFVIFPRAIPHPSLVFRLGFWISDIPSPRHRACMR